MKKENKKKKQKKGSRGKKNSVQELLGIQHFTKYGLMTEHGELVFFQIAPTNISVLSYDNIERKISHLQGLISMHPDLERLSAIPDRKMPCPWSRDRTEL